MRRCHSRRWRKAIFEISDGRRAKEKDGGASTCRSGSGRNGSDCATVVSV